LLLPDKFKPLGITKYDAKQDPIQWLRCYDLHRERWRQQRHQVPLLPLLPGPSSTHMARAAGQALNRQVGPAEGAVHQQLRGRHGPIGTRMDMAMVK
jgi:hypothetical protein